MNKEKPLSEKIDRTFKRYTAGYIPSKAMKFQEDVLKDVAQAVERLKEEINMVCNFHAIKPKEINARINGEIDEIFGDLK